MGGDQFKPNDPSIPWMELKESWSGAERVLLICGQVADREAAGERQELLQQWAERFPQLSVWYETISNRIRSGHVLYRPLHHPNVYKGKGRLSSGPASFHGRRMGQSKGQAMAAKFPRCGSLAHRPIPTCPICFAAPSAKFMQTLIISVGRPRVQLTPSQECFLRSGHR